MDLSSLLCDQEQAFSESSQSSTLFSMVPLGGLLIWYVEKPWYSSNRKYVPRTMVLVGVVDSILVITIFFLSYKKY